MNDWMALWHKLVDWYTRPKTLAVKLISAGVALIGISALGNFAGDMLFKSQEIELRVSGSTTGGLPNAWLYGIGALGLLLVVLGLILGKRPAKSPTELQH